MITVKSKGLQTKEFNAYIKRFNLKEGQKVKAIDFIEWIQDEHKQFRKLNNMKDRPYSTEEQKRFNEFIKEE
jgi:formiminotetrahydrofolate cyclodeaminase